MISEFNFKGEQCDRMWDGLRIVVVYYQGISRWRRLEFSFSNRTWWWAIWYRGGPGRLGCRQYRHRDRTLLMKSIILVYWYYILYVTQIENINNCIQIAATQKIEHLHFYPVTCTWCSYWLSIDCHWLCLWAASLRMDSFESYSSWLFVIFCSYY